MKSVIVAKHPEQETIPAEVLNKIFHEIAPVCLGIAVVDRDGPHILLEHWNNLSDIGATLAEQQEQLTEVLKGLKDYSVLLSFADNAGNTAEKSSEGIQSEMFPMPLLYDDDGKLHLLAALTGDYSEHTVEGRLDAAVAAKEDLMPRIMQAFTAKEVGEDLVRLMAYIRSNTLLQ
ncbi:MAG: hypothetical protein ACREHG_05110, partial [Candidatus Saccharimonadales bacterium]